LEGDFMEEPRASFGLNRFFRRRADPGAPPGMLKVDPQAPAPALHVFSYGPEDFEETKPDSVNSIRALLGKRPVTWVDVAGLGDAKTLEAVGDLFRIHNLALEDVVHVHQRAKVEPYEEHLFIVARMATPQERFSTEQVGIVLGRNFVVTFQERRGDCFDPIRERIRKAKGRIRRAGPDYLAYAILDATVDHYFPVLERMGLELEAIEDAILEDPGESTASAAHRAKRELRSLRRALWPHREVLNTLMRDPSDFVTEDTSLYLRDTFDHVVQIMELLENLRELAADLLDLYMSSVSNRMNEVMKVLTIIATIFIPLGFIAGLYGMNFDPEASRFNMPELGLPFGYPLCLLAMAVAAGGMLLYFRRKGWLGAHRGRAVGDRDGEDGA
jgi:magnesium transporter